MLDKTIPISTATHSDRQLLNRLVSTIKVYFAIKHIGSFKASGPDGCRQYFTKRTRIWWG